MRDAADIFVWEKLTLDFQAWAFNANISKWNVENVMDMVRQQRLHELEITSHSTSHSPNNIRQGSMFNTAKSFNQDLRYGFQEGRPYRFSPNDTHT